MFQLTEILKTTEGMQQGEKRIIFYMLHYTETFMLIPLRGKGELSLKFRKWKMLGGLQGSNYNITWMLSTQQTALRSFTHFLGTMLMVFVCVFFLMSSE